MGQCSLTLRPHCPRGPPVFTYELNVPDSLSNLAVFPPAKKGISLNNNLGDIIYTGNACEGVLVQIYPDKNFKGKPYEVTLPMDEGTLVLPCKVGSTASSIRADFPPEEEELRRLYDAGLLTNDALTKLKGENPVTLKAKLEKLQGDSQKINALKAQAPLTLEQIVELLKEETN